MQTSEGKIVAQVHYASRPPRNWGRQDHLRRILPPILNIDTQNCDSNHNIYAQRNLNHVKIQLSAKALAIIPFGYAASDPTLMRCRYMGFEGRRPVFLPGPGGTLLSINAL
jgi:hypothetical protein